MICKYCGNEIPNNSAFCTHCGQKVEAQPVPAPVPAPAANVCATCGTPLAEGAGFCTVCGTRVEKKAAPKPAGGGLSKNAILGIIAGGAAAVLIGLTVLLICLFSGNSETDVVNSYVKAMCTADSDAFLSLCHDDMLEYILDEGGYDDVEELADAVEDNLQEMLDVMEKNYGDLEEYEYEIVKEKEYSDRKLKNLMEEIDDKYDLDLDISVAKTLEVEFVIYFEDEEVESEMEMTLVKINGDWYLLEALSFA